MSESNFIINVIAFQEEGGWVAQCLEYDIAAQGQTIPDLQYELQRTLISHVVVSAELGREPFAGVGEAPRKFWKMYEDAKTRVERDDLPFRLPDPMPLHVALKFRIAEQSTPF